MRSTIAFALSAHALSVQDAVTPIVQGAPTGTTQLSVALASTPALAKQVTAITQLNVTEAKVPQPMTATALNESMFAIFGPKPAKNNTDFYTKLAAGVSSGIKPFNFAATGPGSLTLIDPIAGPSSTWNFNLRSTPITIYPQKKKGDAPYSISEPDLRKAIYFPPGFTYGKVRPVLFIPGTGVYGGGNFGGNLLKLLTGVKYADPVILNVPGAMIGDLQLNSEYVAYAINYVSTICKRDDIALVTWSQGGLDTQWAFTFWPSTRAVVTSFVAVAPDFRGTVNFDQLCLKEGDIANVACDPAALQQKSTAKFVEALRCQGGTDAYVPTTTLHTLNSDELVQPQEGPLGSSKLTDKRGVGLVTIAPQDFCKGQAAGGSYGHAGLLYNPLVVAVAVDAIKNPGKPADIRRIDLKTVCAPYIASGLSVLDAVDTVGQILAALINMIVYTPKSDKEPPLKKYVLDPRSYGCK